MRELVKEIVDSLILALKVLDKAYTDVEKWCRVCGLENCKVEELVQEVVNELKKRLRNRVEISVKDTVVEISKL